MKIATRSKTRIGAIATLAIATLFSVQLMPANAGQVPFRPAVANSGKGITIGLIGLDDAIGFGKDVHDSIAREAKKAGAKLVFCDSKLNAATALNCAKTFKLKKVQGYLNFQPVASASAAICKAGPNVPVISIDIEQDPCQTAFMGADNHYAGVVTGTAIGNYFKKNFDCKFDAFISLEDYGVGLVNEARMSGYRDGFQAVCGAGSIGDKLIKIDAGRLEPALAKMKDALTTLPNAHHIVVVAINDEGIQGAFAAAKAIGRDGDIYAGSQGAAASAHCDIAKNSHWIGATAYFPERYGEIGVPYLLDLIKGKKVP
ncbi:MAG: substrate-binding domain-containing protein, partial [Actinomycetes bacterium]